MPTKRPSLDTPFIPNSQAKGQKTSQTPNQKARKPPKLPGTTRNPMLPAARQPPFDPPPVAPSLRPRLRQEHAAGLEEAAAAFAGRQLGEPEGPPGAGFLFGLSFAFWKDGGNPKKKQKGRGLISLLLNKKGADLCRFFSSPFLGGFGGKIHLQKPKRVGFKGIKWTTH